MSSDHHSTSTELERTLGLGAALAIGLGTMVGAGIFVFPGIAAGYAGPAAMLSFALAGCIALLVALSTAELATAMPESGGAYFYVSRIFGPIAGFLVGIGQWCGLVFASAFYLTGFAQYSIDFLQEMGVDLGHPIVLIASGTALILTLINLFGTRGAGKLQNRIVLLLAAILSLLFGYGILNAVGLIGAANWPIPFAPNGISPIFSTTALIFTSYLGFVQIATVAGEIKKPGKNLPRALIGSVLIVTVLYVAALFVSSTTLSTEKLAALGETAMVDVARELVGSIGAMAILAAGLLATLSSANASILSSSRAAYALGKDNLIPPVISRVNDRFGTPHIALLAVGLPIAGFTLLGRIEILAEVASLLHLIMYGMICFALITIRRKNPWWYVPVFRSPGVPLLPGIGGICCFGLILLMEPLSIILGAGIVLLALGWYAFLVPETTFSAPVPKHLIPELKSPKILVPVEFPDPDPIPGALLEIFQELDLLVMGYRKVPEQTSPEQSREEFEQETSKSLEALVEDLKVQDVHVESELVFTPDLSQSLNRVIGEKECHAILTAKPIEEVRRLLVPIYSRKQINPRLTTILYDLYHSSQLPISLVVLTSGEEESEQAEDIELMEREAIHSLLRVGFSRDLIRSSHVQVSGIAQAVAQLSSEDDLVILGEADIQDRNRLFSTVQDEIEESVDCPILVVLQEEKQSNED